MSQLHDTSDTGYAHLTSIARMNDEYGGTNDSQSDVRPLISGTSSISKSNHQKRNWVPRGVKKWKNNLFAERSHEPETGEIYYTVFRAEINPAQVPSAGYQETGPTSSQQFEAVVENVLNAIERGIAPKRIPSGSSGSYFMYNTNGRIVGIFKPKDEEPYGPLSPKWTKWVHRNLFPCFFGRSCLIPNNGYISETVASVLDRQLQTFIVPRTEVVFISSSAFYYRRFDRWRYWYTRKPLPPKSGSFQLFLHGYEQADEFFRKHRLPSQENHHYSDNDTHDKLIWTAEALENFRQELEKLVILDYIMRNTDRGLDNWMINLTFKEGDGQKKPVFKLGAIDSGLSFPWKHPDEWRSYPFGWLFLPYTIIGRPFSQKARDHFLPLLTSTAWWEDTYIILRQTFEQDSDFRERMFRKQWMVLKGQAFNVVETLKNHDDGPLELARRTRVVVWDDIMEVPIRTIAAERDLSDALGTPLIPVRPAFALRKNSVQSDHVAQIKLSPIPPNKGKHRRRSSSQALEARYRALERYSGEGMFWQGLFDESAIEANNDQTTIISRTGENLHSLGYSAAQEAGSRRVIMERLLPLNARQPIFTWC